MDRAMLTNCLVEYDNVVKKLFTNSRLLDVKQELAMNVIKFLSAMSKPQLQSRSVLEVSEARSHLREDRSQRCTHVALEA